ncbi:MAG: DUF3526 domain-containing protein [Gammaproteobacteria bacterium]|nr:DUF3526 domain-containing protein [Gammaproteobacteria bacterium]
MIGTIARKEFREIVRDGRFKWTAAFMFLLLLTALLAGWQRYAAYSDARHKAQAASEYQWLNQGDKNPHSAAHYGNYAFKPAGPLSFFDFGVENYTGRQVFMEAHKQNFAIDRAVADSSAIARFGELSGAMILQVLLPLFIVFLGFTAFAGERESGTLRQLESTGVRRTQLLWGKALGIGAAVALVTLPCLAIGALALSLTDAGARSDPQFGARTAIMALSYLLYAGIFLFLTLGVSALAHTARAALVALVGFWAFASFLAPKIAGELSRVVHPSPSFGEFTAALRTDQMQGLDGVSPWVKVEAYKQELFQKYGVDKVADLPVYWPATRMQFLENFDEPIFDLHYGRVAATYAAQQRVQEVAGVLAPTLPLRSVSMGLAGTDLVHHDRFMAAAETYRRDMVERMNGYLAKAASSLNASYSSSNYMTADEKVFAMVPPFTYVPPSLADTLRAHALGLGVLFGPVLNLTDAGGARRYQAIVNVTAGTKGGRGVTSIGGYRSRAPP